MYWYQHFQVDLHRGVGACLHGLLLSASEIIKILDKIYYLESSLKFPIHISSMAFLVETAFYVAVCVTTDASCGIFVDRYFNICLCLVQLIFNLFLLNAANAFQGTQTRDTTTTSRSTTMMHGRNHFLKMRFSCLTFLKWMMTSWQLSSKGSYFYFVVIACQMFQVFQLSTWK